MSKPPKPARLLFFCERKTAFDLKYLPSIYPFALHPIPLATTPFFLPAPNAAVAVRSSSLPFLLTSLPSYSYPPAPLCLPTEGGISVIGFVCIQCAGFEGAQMVMIGVVL